MSPGRAFLALVSHTTAQLQALIDRCEQFRGAPKRRPVTATAWPSASSTGVQSTSVKYASVGKVIDRYRAYRLGQGCEPNSDGVPDLMTTFDELGGPDSWAQPEQPIQADAESAGRATAYRYLASKQ